MKENRGHKPAELIPDFSNGFPIVVPGSSKAANMLKDAMPELIKMGIPVDFDSNAYSVPIMGFPNGINGEIVAANRKVYPNDLHKGRPSITLITPKCFYGPYSMAQSGYNQP